MIYANRLPRSAIIESMIWACSSQLLLVVLVGRTCLSCPCARIYQISTPAGREVEFMVGFLVFPSVRLFALDQTQTTSQHLLVLILLVSGPLLLFVPRKSPKGMPSFCTVRRTLPNPTTAWRNAPYNDISFYIANDESIQTFSYYKLQLFLRRIFQDTRRWKFHQRRSERFYKSSTPGQNSVMNSG